MGVTSQICDGVAKTIEGLFDERTPLFPVKAVFEFLPVIGVAKRITGRRESKRPSDDIRPEQPNTFF